MSALNVGSFIPGEFKMTYFILQTKLDNGWFGDWRFEDITSARETMEEKVKQDKEIGITRLVYRILKVKKTEILRSEK